MAYIEDRITKLEGRVGTLEAKAVPAGTIKPTYLSGSRPGVAYIIADMPTRYIRNCLNMDDVRLARGIRRALEAELWNRED